jgi:hypothetical protein
LTFTFSKSEVSAEKEATEAIITTMQNQILNLEISGNRASIDAYNNGRMTRLTVSGY